MTDVTVSLQNLCEVVSKDMSEAEELFLYAEMKPGMLSIGLFEDGGEVVRYLVTSEEVDEAVETLWHAEEPTKRWGALFLTIKDGQFDARFQYPEEWNADETFHERSQRVIELKYGDREIQYPRWDED
jgi:hypothetical protein